MILNAHKQWRVWCILWEANAEWDSALLTVLGRNCVGLLCRACDGERRRTEDIVGDFTRPIAVVGECTRCRWGGEGSQDGDSLILVDYIIVIPIIWWIPSILQISATVLKQLYIRVEEQCLVRVHLCDCATQYQRLLWLVTRRYPNSHRALHYALECHLPCIGYEEDTTRYALPILCINIRCARHQSFTALKWTSSSSLQLSDKSNTASRQNAMEDRPLCSGYSPTPLSIVKPRHSQPSGFLLPMKDINETNKHTTQNLMKRCGCRMHFSYVDISTLYAS